MKKPRIALWIVLGVLILAFFTAEIGFLAVYKRERTTKYPSNGQWGPIAPYYEDCVGVKIKEEYQEKLVSDGFSKEDFQWGNIDRIEVKNEEITVYLKLKGFLQVNEAVSRFEKLGFVEGCFLYKNLLA